MILYDYLFYCSHKMGMRSNNFVGLPVLAGMMMVTPAVAGAIAVVGTVYFIVDVGMMIFSDKSLSERIDEGVGRDIYKLWDPLLPLGNQYQLQTLPR